MNSKFVKKLVFAGIDSSPNIDLSIYDKPLTFISETDNSVLRIDQYDFWQFEAANEEGREYEPWGADALPYGDIFYRMNENSEYQKYQGEDLILNKNSYVQFNIPEKIQNNEQSWPSWLSTLSDWNRDCLYRRFSTWGWNRQSLFSCEGNVSSIIGYGSYLWEIFQRM